MNRRTDEPAEDTHRGGVAAADRPGRAPILDSGFWILDSNAEQSDNGHEEQKEV